MLWVRRIASVCLPALATLALAACGSSTSSSSPSSSSSSAVASGSGSSSPTVTTTFSTNPCSVSSLKLHTPGVLTVATDSPAYPPYFANNDPKNGKGFESAVAYAVAQKMGFSKSQVHWVVEHFNNSYQPGPKSFDFDINEISITKQRAQAVDFSTPYYTNPQAIIVDKNSPLAHATSLAAFKGTTFGVQIGTTSLEAVQQEIKPSATPNIFNNSNDVTQALKIHRVQAIVTDLATAFYITSAQLTNTVIAGQFNAPGGDKWGLLLTKGSALTPCVDQAVQALQTDGTLASLNKQWIASAASVPVLH